MNGRSFVICLALTFAASAAYAGGAYQRTEDRKIFVWNNSPSFDDAVKWSGDRDSEGYATGFGTISWYRINRGFLTGSYIPLIKYHPISQYSGKMVHGKLEGKVETVAPNGNTVHATFAEGRRKTEWKAGPTAARERRPEEPTSPGAVVEAPAEAPSPARSSTPSPIAAQQAKEGGAVTATGDTTQRSGDLLRTLAAPPKSLRATPQSESSSKAQETSSSMSTAPRLTQTEVIDLADTAVRGHGDNLDDYRRPRADYAATNQSWSVVYDDKSADESTGTAKHLSVIIDDKTKKASITAGP